MSNILAPSLEIYTNKYQSLKDTFMLVVAATTIRETGASIERIVVLIVTSEFIVLIVTSELSRLTLRPKEF